MNKFMKTLLFSLLVPLVLCAAPVKSGTQFKTSKLKIGGQVLTVELAETTQQQGLGLMFRKKMPEDKGMLFIFPDTQMRSFWMKNTFLALSIGFFDQEKKLIDIQDMSPAKSEMQTDFPTYQSTAPAKYALEVNQGWFTKHKIKVGDRFELIK